MQSPKDLESLPHGLDARAHPLERESLPAGEHDDVAGRRELSKVIDELARHCPGGACHDQGPPTRQVSEGGNRDRAGNLDDQRGARWGHPKRGLNRVRCGEVLAAIPVGRGCPQ